MVQGYYNLQEAAEYLGISPDALKQLAQRKEVRSFQDRGTLRFRIQDVQELARKRGGDSDPELVLGEASLPPPKQPAPGPKTPSMKKKEAPPEVFSFDFDDDKKDPASGVHGSRSKPKSKVELKPKSDAKKSKPAHSDGSDSDVRLVAEGSVVGFSVGKDSGVKLGSDSDVKVPSDPASKANRKPSKLGSPKSPGPKSPKSSGSGAQPIDSGVRLVPMDSDSDVKILGSSDEVSLGDHMPSVQGDSNVRLEKVQVPTGDSGEGTLMFTEEINLDEELKKQEAKDKAKAKQPTKIKAKSELKFPTSSPFELSDSDLEMPSELKTSPKKDLKKDSSDFDLAAQKKEGSSDFDLVPNDDGSILLEGDGDFSLELNDDNQVDVLEGNEPELTGPTSGISLGNPVDGGVSLEGSESDDSLDFDLSLESSATPKPDRGSPLESSDSEFELSLDLSDGGKSADDSDSEFELSLDAAGGGGDDSDSEFELTLDDSGDQPQVKASAKDDDIFETDFEVPALDEDSSATDDTDLESSDFDLALDDSEVVPEDESGSHVVALDEEEVETEVDSDDAADVEVDDEKEGFAEIEEGDDEEAVGAGKGGPVREVVREKILQPAPWGVLPVIFMIPCVFTMVLVAFMGFEAVMTGNGFKAPMFVTKLVGENVMQQKFPPNFPQRP